MARNAEGNAQISATVPSSMKTQVAQRATAEDRQESAVVRRALDCYLAMSLADAEQAVARARSGAPEAPAE